MLEEKRKRPALWFLLLVSFCVAPRASAESGESGLFYIEGDRGGRAHVTSLGSSVHIQVTGIVATASVWQIFENPIGERIDALYTFPVPERVAVDRLEMLIGDRTITGVVRETVEAERVFAQAAAEGRSASLVKKVRSNVFSTAVANIPPHETVEIAIGWQQEITYDSGVFRLRLPTALVSRYGVARDDTEPVDRRLSAAGADHQLGLRIDLDLGFAAASVESPSHDITVERLRGSRYAVELAEGVVPADRDFVLEWRPKPSTEPQVVAFSSMKDGEQYVLLMAIPPSISVPAYRSAREAIFVIDTSGSMEGEAIVQAQAALATALDRLQPQDRFNVIHFNTSAHALFPDSVPAASRTLAEARDYVARLTAGGGTEMMAALDRALADDRPGGEVRQVIFITDGRVSGEQALFSYITTHLGRSRLFAVGIGPTPNEHFLRNAARHGRGSLTSVSDASRVREQLGGLLERLEAPALTDLSVVWPDALADLAPERIPDLYAGEPLTVAAKVMPLEGAVELSGWFEDGHWEGSVDLPSASGRAEIRGLRGEEPWTRRLSLPRGSRDAAIAKLWAARKIQALTDRLLTAGADEAQVRREVTEIALRYQLVSRYTSLIAEDEALSASVGVAGLSVRTVDSVGNPIAGVTVEVSGGGGAWTGVTGVNGDYTFAGLGAGNWQLIAALDGFSSVEYPSVDIVSGRTTVVEIQMSSAVNQVITVTSESPLLDERLVTAGATISQIELEKIPTARDPWSMLSRSPGVTVDRIGLGGAEPNSFRAPGKSASENQLMVDGVDVSELLASDVSGRFDLDQLTEVRLSTGGADVTKLAGGVSVNLVTKRGTNEFRGSARFLVTDSDAFLFVKQSSPDIDDGDLGEGQAGFVGNGIEQIEEWGFEAGGPVVQDRLWFWGAHGQHDIRELTGGDVPSKVESDDTALDNTALRVNAQVAGANSMTGSWRSGDRERLGRDAGPARPRPTSWNQRGPSAVVKLEDTHVIHSNLFITGTWASVDGGFDLRSAALVDAGLAAPQAHLDAEGIWQGSFENGRSDRDSRQLGVKGSYFFLTHGASHELKFGSRARAIDDESSFGWSNDGAWSIGVGDLGGAALLTTQRGSLARVEREHATAWVQDTISWSAWTINAGLRYDLQSGRNPSQAAGANPWFPSLQPELAFAGSDASFDWRSVSPRVGLTWALGEDRETLLRASLSRFPSQLASADVGRTNPAGRSYLVGLWTDIDGSGDFNGSTLEGNGPDEVGLAGTRDFDLESPLTSPNRTDPGLSPELTDELLLGLEHALLPEFVVGAQLIGRRISDLHEERALVRDADGGVRVNREGDYVLDRVVAGALPGGEPYAVPAWALAPSLGYTGGALLTNGDREREYLGLNLHLNKRLSGGWMLRGYLQLGEATWIVPQSFRRFQSPNVCADSLSFGCNGAAGGTVDGGLFAAREAGPGSVSSGSSSGWSQSRWQTNVSGMYQVAPTRPWGFNVAANVFAREGHPVPYFLDVLTADGQDRDLLATERLDARRLEDVFTLDLRVDKEIAASGDTRFTIGAEVFNALNESPVLERERGLARGSADFARETLSPRIWRLSARIDWR
jgi:Ca-activated chloride channel family protein